MKLPLLLVVFFVWLTPASGEELFQYSIASHPKDPAVGCGPAAREIGRRFSALTGKRVFQAICDADTRSGYDVIVTYVSDTKIPYMSTLNEGGYDYLGVYRSREECDRNLPQEIQWFEGSTGLRHFLSYCYPVSDTSPTSFAAFVDGFGVAKLNPYHFEITLWGEAISSGLEKKLFDLTLSAGIQVKQVAVAHSGSKKLVIRYYDSPENTLFRSDYFVVPYLQHRAGREVAVFKSQEDCLFSGEKVLDRFPSVFTDRSVWFCDWNPFLFKAALYQLYVKPRSTFEGELVPRQYNSFQQCETERNDVIEFYKSELKKDILGGLCTWQEISWFPRRPEGYYLQVFSEKKEGL